MKPELFYASMLITEPQKARRILLAEELENWFMDLFDEEFADILNGSFKSNQEAYIDKIVDKYLEITKTSITANDAYSKVVIDRAFRKASKIQEVTWNNITAIPAKNKRKDVDDFVDSVIKGVAVSAIIANSDKIETWLGQSRANLIALNEANWKYNNEEYFEAKARNKKKIWHTSLDERVRPTHEIMEGVTVDIDEPFNVGTSQMMFAGDDSLGASESELDNCRCSTEYK